MNKVKEAEIAYAIYEKVRALPAAEQAAVLDFVDTLQNQAREETEAWMALSLAAALRGMEDEVWPDYEEDLATQATEQPPATVSTE
jgi:hypothetical protein